MLNPSQLLDYMVVDSDRRDRNGNVAMGIDLTTLPTGAGIDLA